MVRPRHGSARAGQPGQRPGPARRAAGPVRTPPPLRERRRWCPSLGPGPASTRESRPSGPAGSRTLGTGWNRRCASVAQARGEPTTLGQERRAPCGGDPRPGSSRPGRARPGTARRHGLGAGCSIGPDDGPVLLAREVLGMGVHGETGRPGGDRRRARRRGSRRNPSSTSSVRCDGKTQGEAVGVDAW